MTSEHEETPGTGTQEAARPGAAAAPQSDTTLQEAEQQAPVPAAVPVAPYKLTAPIDNLPASDIPDGYEETLESFATAAAEGGVDARTAQRLVNAYTDAALDVRYNGDYSMDDAQRFLELHWGQDYDRRMALMRKAIPQLGGDRLRRWLDETGQGNNPAVIIALSRYGEGALSMTKAEAQAKLDAIMKDPKHAHWNPTLGGRERKRLTAEIRTLNAIANEEEAPQATVAASSGSSSGSATHASFADFKRAQYAASNAVANPRAEIQKMMADKSGPLMNSGHREHAAAVKRYHELVAKL